MKPKRINYITTDGWWDTDRTILPQIEHLYSIYVYVMDGLGTLKFPQKDKYGEKLDVFTQKYRIRDPRLIIRTIRYFIKISNVVNRKDSLNVFIYGGSIYFLLLFLIFCPRKNTIIGIHNFQEHIGKRKDYTGIIKKLFYKSFMHFQFYDTYQERLFCAKHRGKKTYSLKMPLKDFGVFGGKTTMSENHKVTFLFFGNIEDYKRLDLFIKAANKIDTNKALFRISGNCRNWGKYKSMIFDKERYEINIRFIENVEIPEIFSTSDFLVLPYQDATQSGPALIAINYGLPIIASNLPAFTNIITNDVNGYLFENGNASDLESAFQKATELSPHRLKTIKDNMKEFKMKYESYNIKEIFGEFVDSIK